jgi:DivIVA domain-containing protein
MTDSTGTPLGPRLSPHAIRKATFSQRIRGCDPTEVREFLERVADALQAAEDERLVLLAEIERLRTTARPVDTPDPSRREEINAHAVALFSQAQLVADRLVAEHVEHSRSLMTNARAQQRELLTQAQRNHHGDGGVGGAPLHGGTSAAGGSRNYGLPVPEIEYVRTYTQIAQTQLRSVIEALSEQVDKLSDLPRLNDGRDHPRELAQ